MSPHPPRPWRILIVKPDHLGDFALALPALWEARRFAGADASIDILAYEENREWPSLLPWISRVKTVYYPKYDRRGRRGIKLFSLFGQALQLRSWKSGGYDWGIEMTSWAADPWGKAYLLAAGARRRRGLAGTWNWMIHERVGKGQGHQVARMAERMPPCWGATGQSNPADFMPQDFLWHKRSDGPTLLMPWAGERFKEWNLNGWRATLRQVPIERTRLLFPTDRQGEAMDFAHACGIARDHMIRLGTIRETLKLLSQASLLISVDTAAAHYAWLTGTPLVELFSASADVERWKSLAMGEIFAVAPGDRRHACSYREKLAGGMMDHIRPHDVAAAIRRRLG